MAGRSFVRETGRLLDMDGLPLVVGVDHDAVTITAGKIVIRLAAAQMAQFSREFNIATYQAGRQAARLED